MVPHLTLLALVAVLWDVRLIPVVGLVALVTVLAWRSRGRLPEALRGLRELLGEGEEVLGDGVGTTRGALTRSDAVRLVVATDRRVLMTRVSRSGAPLVLVDAPYREVTRFGIEWRALGRVGELKLTVPDVDGRFETHVVGSIAPLNLLSIARTLDSNRVAAEDPDALAEAERAWEEAQRGEAVKPVLDRTAMATGAFDRGLWLLVGVSALLFHVVNLGFWVTVAVVGALCVLCGYWCGTRSALAYVLPLNVLMAPAIFYANASVVILLMVLVSAVAAAGLWAGAALRRGAPGAPERHTGVRQAIGGAESGTDLGGSARRAARPDRGRRVPRVRATDARSSS